MKTAFVLLLATQFAVSGFGQRTQVERGEYLVEHVAACQDCHTRRLVTGQFDRSAWLRGAILRTRLPSGRRFRVVSVPNITSSGSFWKQWAGPGVIHLLATGNKPDGAPPDAAMPAYRLRRDDAAAIAAYLNLLK